MIYPDLIIDQNELPELDLDLKLHFCDLACNNSVPEGGLVLEVAEGRVVVGRVGRH